MRTYGSGKRKEKEKIDESKLGFKSNLGKKEAMARIMLEEIRDFCGVEEWESEEVMNENRAKMIKKLQRCKKFLEEDPLGQKCTKHFGTILNASTDASIGTIPKVRLSQADYDLAEEYDIDPDEAYAYRMAEKERKIRESGRGVERGLKKTMRYGAEGMYAVTDPKGYTKDKLLDVPPPPDGDIPVCLSCSEPGEYIEKYNRYYCRYCSKYLPKDATPPPPEDSGEAPPPSGEELL